MSFGFFIRADFGLVKITINDGLLSLVNLHSEQFCFEYKNPPIPAEYHSLIEKIISILDGKNKSNKDIPIDISCGTQFQQDVWNVIKDIPFGHTLTYKEVANKIGRPKAVRAVGSACSANPIPVIIPCHRVVPSKNGIGSYAYGKDIKKILLDREIK